MLEISVLNFKIGWLFSTSWDPGPFRHTIWFMTQENEQKAAEKIIAEVGGDPDECGVCLAIYGEGLIPDEITALLGCQPTDSHIKGEKKGPRSPGYSTGAWFLKVRGEPPNTPEILTRKLLMMVPSSPEIWEQLKTRFDVQIRYGIHISGWNKGFGLPNDLIDRISVLRADVGFDIYSYEAEDVP